MRESLPLASGVISPNAQPLAQSSLSLVLFGFTSDPPTSGGVCASCPACDLPSWGLLHGPQPR